MCAMILAMVGVPTLVAVAAKECRARRLRLMLRHAGQGLADVLLRLCLGLKVMGTRRPK